jgi:DNA polymerase III delta prime subunit
MPQLAEQTAPRLFISYSHDSAEHEDRVLALADRLRHDGIDALIDQYDTAPPDGWPMWMDREIQKADFVAMVCTETYLRRVEGRESPGKGRGVLWEAKLIYNTLYPEDFKVQRFIPVLFAGGQSSFIPLPIRGSTYYQVDSEEGYEDFYRHLTGQPRHGKPALGKLKALPAIEPQSYPSSLEMRAERKPPTSLDQRNRLQMLKRVRLDWIDGVLKQSLYQIARIEFGLKMKFDAVEQPLKAVVQTPDRPPATAPTGVSISQVFHDHGGALLILGAPGTGKTTILLELAQELLDRAERDENHPIPVVFNLSSWAVRRQTLDRWLADELNERSDVPKRPARQWVETEQVLPLLDGLDEVAMEHRQACAEAINNFRRDHGLLQIAVCSRIADYDSLGTKLRLRTAIVVQPLTAFEVQGYLERISQPADAALAALKSDPSFRELLETPLMLWVAMLAYRDAPVELSIEDTFEQRRRRLFASFIDAMFKRRSAESRYTQKETLSWLCWLARALTGTNRLSSI